MEVADPWVLLDAAKGKLKGNGALEVEVQGLVIPGACGGADCNPVRFFRALVSCIDGNNEDVRYRPMLRVYNGCGLRLGAVLGLRVADILVQQTFIRRARQTPSYHPSSVS
jgi:hypothetical protein